MGLGILKFRSENFRFLVRKMLYKKLCAFSKIMSIFMHYDILNELMIESAEEVHFDSLSFYIKCYLLVLFAGPFLLPIYFFYFLFKRDASNLTCCCFCVHIFYFFTLLPFCYCRHLFKILKAAYFFSWLSWAWCIILGILAFPFQDQN